MPSDNLQHGLQRQSLMNIPRKRTKTREKRKTEKQKRYQLIFRRPSISFTYFQRISDLSRLLSTRPCPALLPSYRCIPYHHPTCFPFVLVPPYFHLTAAYPIIIPLKFLLPASILVKNSSAIAPPRSVTKTTVKTNPVAPGLYE